MIIIPNCEHSCWYQVIVIKLGLIVDAPVSEARRLKGEPFFIVLDSLGNGKSQNEAVIDITWLMWQTDLG